MGATLSTYALTVYKLTPDGLGGFWWVAKDSNNRAYQINYNDSIVESAAQLFHTGTFLTLLNAMNTAGIQLPQVEVNINVDAVADLNGLQAQFTSITNAQINAIALVYDPYELCKLFGAFPLIRKFYQNGHLTAAQALEIFLYLGVRRKVFRPKIENVMNALLNAGDINQSQYDDFWIAWDTQVGT